MTFTHAGPEPDVDPARIAALPRAADPTSGASAHAHALPGVVADPGRRGTGAGMHRQLASLQRTAGNRAVASLLSLQRAPVQIEEMSVRTSVGDTPVAPPGSSGPVTSDGATTTVSGSTINLAAPMVSADGVLRASTIIADNVVASSYTPGAGNLW